MDAPKLDELVALQLALQTDHQNPMVQAFAAANPIKPAKQKEEQCLALKPAVLTGP